MSYTSNNSTDEDNMVNNDMHGLTVTWFNSDLV